MMSKEKDPIPQGKYVPATRSGSLIFTAGMTSRKDGRLILSGKVSPEVPVETYKEAVVQAAANALTAAKNRLEEDERIAAVLQMNVFVNAAEGFLLHSKIADFASEYCVEQLGERGIAARAAIGAASLPGEAPVEIQMIAAAEKI